MSVHIEGNNEQVLGIKNDEFTIMVPLVAYETLLMTYMLALVQEPEE